MWGNFCVFIWKCNKTFSSFQGKSIKAFIKSIPVIVDCIENNFSEAEHLIHLAKVMKVWKNIQEFWHKVTVNEATYMEELSKFRSDTKEFYEYGADKFLTKTTKGNQEAFYSHTLRYYLPYIAEKKFHWHTLGLEIWTMQWFERRNKESKNVYNRFTNKKGNVLTSNLKRLSDIFIHEKCSV